MAIDPRVDSKICTGCKIRRSCVRTIGIPPCAKQFFEPDAQFGEAPSQQLKSAISYLDRYFELDSQQEVERAYDILSQLAKQTDV